ncbi:2-Hydroxyacid oxidase 1-like [Uloborus diversus]|uniref:2-Hydroxyacid oxidase 1-like n=1 Tax=Uloborus diversus TaxID=327109 RepID=UPI002409CF17|nr:2-Hydroxyacid oxidase 1-like [Uloborus diversus]
MLCLKEYEDYARQFMDKRTWAFYSQGAEREETLRENLLSFTRFKIIPRLLRNTPTRDLRVTVLGNEVALPFGIAPSAYQRLAHPDGEIAASRAASEMDTIYTLSTVSTTSLEDIAKHQVRNTPLFMQVYLLKERRYSAEMIYRAEKCGYKALVLTVDTPVTGLQLKLWRTNLVLPPHLSIPNIADAVPKGRNAAAKNVDLFLDTISWEDVDWIKRISKLPLILKGIITVDDAVEAVKHGVSAIWVSNHGGRQLDCIDTALEALPDIVAALKGSGCEIYVDGGVRWGSDIFKALALGANFVFIGRPALWGLAHSGQEGVKRILEILKTELDRTMHLAGCSSIKDIGPHMLKNVHSSKI